MRSPTNKPVRLALALSLLVCCVGCDQATKYVATKSLCGAPPLSCLSNTLRLEYALNPGGFLSVGSNLTPQPRFWVFVALNTVAILFVIRKAQRADARDVRAVRDAAILSGCAQHYPAALLEQWTAGPMDDGFIEDVAARFYIASIDNRIVATGCIDLKSGEIGAVFVLPDRMRSGIGRAMVHHLEQLAIDAGLSRLTLDSTLNAARFYRSCGYVGQTVGRYDSPRGISLDCIPMTKELAPSTPSNQVTDGVGFS